ncbi:unnamed protein product [Cuscuta campestris]|uniref:CCHC-type domain-containing protein n=1 Tax=Cuscuta campestris TaxID=132261 RepID=A0A484MA19_9ASTE|nr:unnamed protein product [Cuscuta campestris]
MENPERNPATPDVVQYIPKPKEKWDDRDCKKHNLDNVAKAAIFKTLDPITFSKIKHLKTAMEIWQGLGKLCEGSEDLRTQKIEVLLEKFKGFKMLLGESFDMLDERFHKILNDLASLNHVLSPKEKNVRLLRSLPTEWYTKATAMEEGRNLENYTVQGLLDELRTYEHELKKKKEEQVIPFPTALMTAPRVPLSEGTCTSNCDTPSSSQPSSSKMENYDEEFAMMVKQFRKFKKFFKKADSVRRPSKGKPQVSDSPPESYLCYNCRKPGHWKSACPYPKVVKYGERERTEKKKKAMVAAESDESSSSSSDEEALFKKMMKDFEEINLKHSSLTEENKLLSEENLKLTEGRKSQLNEITQLKTENESLSEKVKSLNKELGTLKSKEAVDKLLETTKHKGREGLGFDSSSSKRKTTFIPPKPTAKPNKQKGKEKEKPTEVSKKEATKYPGVWYLDSGCSRHMTGDMSLLSNLIPYDGPRVTFGGSNDFGLTKGLGNLVYKGLTIQAVSYVEGLNYNLLSISQFWDKAKKADLNNDYKLIMELVIACLECGSGGHADDITQERAFIINALITKTKVNWAAHFFNSISKHLGKPNQKYLCQGLYLGHILESMGIASKGKKYRERYWLYYLSSKGENRAGTSATAEESSSDNVPLIHMTKTAKRKQVVSPSISIEAPQNLALINLEEEEEVSDHGELQRKKKRKINSSSTSKNVNSDELKEKETAEETSIQNRSPQQFEEEIPQV